VQARLHRCVACGGEYVGLEQHIIVNRHKGSVSMTAQLDTPEKPFRLEEATIAELHAAILAPHSSASGAKSQIARLWFEGHHDG
jgi:hypothetical protein